MLDFFPLVFYGSHNKHHQQQQQQQQGLQEHSTSSAAHCVLANRTEIVSKSEPESGVLGQGDDGRMPIMCGHKVMKILSDSGNSCTLSALAFDLISKDRRGYYGDWEWKGEWEDRCPRASANDTILCGQHVCQKVRVLVLVAFD